MKLNKRTLLASTLLLALSSGIAAPAHAQDSLEKVKTSGALRIGVTPAEPWFYKDIATNEWKGVGVEIGQRMAKDLGVTFTPVETTWANAVAAIQADQIDIMFVLDATEERRKAIDFPKTPLFYYALGALVRDDNAAQTWDELNKSNLRVGVTLGTSNDRILTAKLPDAQLNRFANNDELVAAFAAGRIDVVGLFHPALTAQYSKLKMGKVILPKPTDAVPTSAGVRRNEDSAFVNWVDERVTQYYGEGVAQKAFSNYLDSRGIDPSTIPGLVKEEWK